MNYLLELVTRCAVCDKLSLTRLSILNYLHLFFISSWRWFDQSNNFFFVRCDVDGIRTRDLVYTLRVLNCQVKHATSTDRSARIVLYNCTTTSYLLCSSIISQVKYLLLSYLSSMIIISLSVQLYENILIALSYLLRLIFCQFYRYLFYFHHDRVSIIVISLHRQSDCQFIIWSS